MAILAASLFLAFAARGADFNGAHSPVSALIPQAGKTGVGNNDYPRYRAVATGERYAAFLLPPWLACSNSDRYCAGFTHAIRFAAVRAAGRFIGLPNGAFLCRHFVTTRAAT